MSGVFQISEVRFSSGPATHVERGLLGWFSFVLNGSIRIDGVSLRRTADGRLALSYPARVDSSGREWRFIRPLSDTVRRDIEHQVLAAVGYEGGPAR